MLGRKVNEVIRTELTTAQRVEALQTLAETGHYYAEMVQYCRNGRRLWVQGDTTALRDEAGHIIGYLNTSRDVTGRKQAEDDLRRSEAHLAEAQRIGHVGSWIWNVATGEVFWSREMFRIYDLDPGQARPDYPGVMQYIHPEDRPRVRQVFDDAVRDKREYELAYRVMWADGTVRHVNNLARPVFNESGSLIEYVGTTIDTTERKRAEEALQKSQAELAHVWRVTALGELTASIAHEVNQSLGAIVTNGQAVVRLLSRESPDLAKSREVVEQIIDDGMRASQVIARIRAMLKKKDGEKTPLDINEIIQEVSALTSAELGKSEIHLRTELGGGLTPVVGDRVQLQQVILNLVLNAKEAMDGPGWQPRHLSIRSQQSSPDEVCVAVRDTGTGIEPQSAQRLFEAFFTTKAGGLGLGLSISRSIIEAHGGRLWAAPNPGRGTTMEFTLPASRERTG